jgi:hypothetical protein
MSSRKTCAAMVLAGFLLGWLCQEAEGQEVAPGASVAEGRQVRLPIGMNLAGINDYSTGYPFKNLMWGARAWLTKNADGRGPHDSGFAAKLELDQAGYPLEVPATIDGAPQPQTVFTIIPNVTEAGHYVVLYDGEGEITAAMSSKMVESAPGRVVLELAGKASDSGYEGIAIKRSVRGNHVRNIRILAEADEKADLAANPFREDFLAYCKQWHALRFMDWQVTNNSLEREWAGRKLPTFYTMVGSGGDAIGRWGKPASEFQQLFSGGVALELIIQLANMTETDAWVCVPHRATEEYMTEMAKLFKEKLDPKLKVYVEYSNEVWNWQFQQAGWMLQSKIAGDRVMAAGGKAWKDGVQPEFPYENGTVAKDGGEGHPERMAALDRRCFEQWEAVFSGSDRARLVRVIGVQHAWTDTARRTAKWVMANGGADALSPAGYFGPKKEIYERWEAAGASLTAEQVIADMHEAFEQDSAGWTREIAAIAKEHKLRFIVYEGGQHIQPKDQKETAYLPALKAAQYHPGLYDVYMKNLALHQEVGCDLFMAFSSVGKQGLRWGSWGHQERYGQSPDEMPKLKALLDANTPR